MIKNKSKSKSTRNYSSLYDRLKTVHNFTFKKPAWNKGLSKKQRENDIKRVINRDSIQRLITENRLSETELKRLITKEANDININRHLTARQKTAISHLWDGKRSTKTSEKITHGLENAVKLLESKQAQFIPVKNANRKEVLRNMKYTNKGVFIFQSNVNVTIKGRGRSIFFDIDELPDPKIQLPRAKSVFFPFPSGVVPYDYMKCLEKIYKPHSMALGVMSARSNAEMSISGFNYVSEAVESYKTEGQKHPFSGVYFYWY